jgi:hypothetical protein
MSGNVVVFFMYLFFLILEGSIFSDWLILCDLYFMFRLIFSDKCIMLNSACGGWKCVVV